MNFVDFAAAHGLIVDRIEAGRWVRVPTKDHPRSKNGAYFFDGDYAHVQNWAEMSECVTWRDDRPMTLSETHAMKLRMEASRLAHAMERKHAQQQATGRAKAIIKQAKYEQHAYLDSKGFRDMPGLVWYPDSETNLLVIPMRADREIVGCQLISRDGEKKFLRGQKTNGAEFVIGTGGVDVWCEGYATALSIHAALMAMRVQCRVHACFSAGNLQRMAKRGFVVADNDPGSCAGIKAAKSTGLPYWVSDSPGEDFNDFHQSRGTFAAGMELRNFLNAKRARR